MYGGTYFFQYRHFVTQTAATIDWAVESEVHLLALSCDYLLHGVLSTAALHMAYSNPEQEDSYNYLSTQHQELALGTISIGDVTDQFRELSPSFCLFSTVACFSVCLFSLYQLLATFARNSPWTDKLDHLSSRLFFYCQRSLCSHSIWPTWISYCKMERR